MLIISVSRWLINSVCQHAKKWQASGLLNVPIAINISPVQFNQQSLSKIIRSCLEINNLSAEFIELELSETTLEGSDGKVLNEIELLVDLGVKLVIDNFGAGYSSLAYLKHLPVSKLKIDSQFFNKAVNNELDLTILSSITSLAHKLNLKVIAKGIEETRQLEIARNLKIDGAQGYFFSYPLSTEECEQYLLRNVTAP
jgi:EAL domain-containing protein (putative c-di-GMP-specific phosphodiesterase class I)